MQRQFIRDGDTTTTGGTVHASGSQDLLDGRNTCWEGDPVYCPACKSTGHTKCVQPYRPYTRDGKQINLDGDLCICKCRTPPRLKSKFNNSAMSFDGGAIAGNVAAAGWLLHAGHNPTDFGVATGKYDEQFLLRDGAGAPLAEMAYTVKLPDGSSKHGVTNGEGYTGRYITNGETPISVYVGHLKND